MQLPSIWVARPQAQAEYFAAKLKLRSIPTIICPVMEMIALPLRLPALLPDAIVISSQHALHALEALPEAWRSIPVYTVGDRTAQATQALGHRTFTGHSEGALSMAARIRETLPHGSHILYLSGDIVHTDLANELPQHEIERQEVYRALAVEKPSPTLIAALNQQQVIAVTCFSSRSAQLASAQLQQAGLGNVLSRLHALCLSAGIALAAQQAGFSHTRTTDTPTDEAMLILAEQAIRAMA